MENIIKMEEMDFFKTWLKEQKLPEIGGYYIEDAIKVPVEPWDMLGGLAAYLDLVGAEEETAAFIYEIPPGGSLKPQKHLFEEFIYVVSGRGTVSVWYGNAPKQTFDWQVGSLFSPPLNAWYQLSNSQADKPVRLLVVTGAPVFMNLFHSHDFTFNNDFEFRDRYAGESNYFSGEGRLSYYTGGPVWESNFIKDVRSFELTPAEERGTKGSKLTNFCLSQNTMEAHSSEFAIGAYKKAHRHGAGANIIIISGKGYSYMWLEGEPRQRFDWHEGTIIVPPEAWFHQHFNTGTKPARYLALRWMSKKYRYGKWWEFNKDVKKGGDQIEYADEAPEIRRIFEAELAKEGPKSKMD